jgi:small subunit ribosomal protein S9
MPATKKTTKKKPATKTTKKTVKKKVVKKTVKKTKASNKYFEAVGRRKSSIARIRLFEKTGEKGTIQINEKELSQYFPLEEHRKLINSPLIKTKTEKNFFVSCKVYGGGTHSQSQAIRHGISRALLKVDPEFRPILKLEGFLTRDSRAKERRKFGLKKARKAPQWSKR